MERRFASLTLPQQDADIHGEDEEARIHYSPLSIVCGLIGLPYSDAWHLICTRSDSQPWNWLKQQESVSLSPRHLGTRLYAVSDHVFSLLRPRTNP